MASGNEPEPSAPRKCRICESAEGPWTEEDAYPKWLRKRIFEWLRSLPEGIPEQGWEQGARVLLKPVCQRCQRKLNEVFEIPNHDLLKAMLDGSVIKLSPQQQMALAGWTFKTALVLILERTTNPYAIQVLQRYLRDALEGGTPPSNATVRLAYLTDSLKDSRGGFLPPGWPDVLDPSEGFWSVISVPGFLGETITGPMPVVRSYIEATKDDDRFILVWPPQLVSVVWPAIPLGFSDSEAMREAWQHSEWLGNFPTLMMPPEPETEPPQSA